MKKFYVFQQDLIKYKEMEEDITISKFVKNLNLTFCEEGMKKLRTEEVLKYLMKNDYLFKDECERWSPTKKGRLLGIRQEIRNSSDGKSYTVNILSKKTVSFLLDNLYNII